MSSARAATIAAGESGAKSLSEQSNSTEPSGFGKRLAHSEKHIRDEAVKSLQQYLIEHSAELSDLGFLKLWKGLYFCFWMSDKPLIQQELATNLACTVMILPSEQALRYIDSFWKILISEWPTIDRHRLDKFNLLCRRIHFWTFKLLQSNDWNSEMVARVVGILEAGPLSTGVGNIPDGVRYHAIRAVFQEVARAQASIEKSEIPSHTLDSLCNIYFDILSKTRNPGILNSVISDFLGIWLSEEVETPDPSSVDPINPSSLLQAHITPQQLLSRVQDIITGKTTPRNNRRPLYEFAKNLSNARGVPFNSMQIAQRLGIVNTTIHSAGMADSKKKLRKEKKRKLLPVSGVVNAVLSDTMDMEDDDPHRIEEDDDNDHDHDNGQDSSLAELGSSKKRKRNEKKQNKVSKPVDASTGATDQSESNAQAAKQSTKQAKPPTVEAPAASALSQTPPKRSKMTDPVQEDSQAQSDNQDDAQSVAPPSAERKSVRWGEKMRVKTFYKAKAICPADQVKTPEHKPAVKSVLKKTTTEQADSLLAGSIAERTAASTLANSRSSNLHSVMSAYTKRKLNKKKRKLVAKRSAKQQ